MTDRTVGDVGEFGLIAELRAALTDAVVSGAELQEGIGDDAAVWNGPSTQSTVITTDGLVEGVHFRLEWTDWRSLGHKAIAVNLSDLAAMGANPKLAFVTLAVRADLLVDDLVEMYRGMGQVCRKAGVLIAGGDIVSTPAEMQIHITAIGNSRHRRVLTRHGARAGDAIGVSGTLGAAAAGLRLLGEASDSTRRRATTADTLIAAHLRPEPRIELGRVLLERGASAAMDLSDGLYGDLPRILTLSGVGARVRQTDIPVAAAVRTLFPGDWLELATRGGEDYELLFTAPPAAFTEIASRSHEVGSTVTEIGEIVAGPPVLAVVDSQGESRIVNHGAFEHFGRSN